MLIRLALILTLSACGIEDNQHSTLPDCDSIPSHVEYGTGSMPVSGHSEPGKVYGPPPTQADLDQRERDLANTHLPAGPRCRPTHAEGAPSPVAPTPPPRT